MFRVGLSQTLDLNASLNGGAADTGVTYEAAPGSAAVLTVNSSTGVVTPVGVGTAVVLVKENGVTIDEVLVKVLTDAEMTARDEIEAGTKRVVVSGSVGVPGVSRSFTINGGAKISTAQQKFGAGSLLLGDQGDFLSIVSPGSNFEFGSGDFTIEAWVYTLSLPNVWGCYVFQTEGSWQNGAVMALSNDNHSLRAIYDSSPVVDSPDPGGFIGVWRHVAVTRQGGIWRAFADGQSSSGVSNSVYLTGSRPWVGANYQAMHERFNGHINGLRVTKGVARYTSSFTPQATALSLTGDPHADKVVLLANFNGTQDQTNISYTAFQ